jgi:hypothetical protein
VDLAAEVAVALSQRLLTWQMEAAMGALHTVDRFRGAGGLLLQFSLAEQVANDEVESAKGQYEQEISKSHEKIL